jgi:hypothetical protein
MNKEDACLLLKINSIDLNERVLKEKYRIAILKYHPDKNGDAETFIKIKQAYEYLKKDIESNPLDYYIQLIKNFNYKLVDNYIVEPIVHYLKKITYELKPTLSQLLNKNVYYLSQYDIYIPLWHHEIIFKNVTININPVLPNNIIIDNDNNIHIIIKNNDIEDIMLGDISFVIEDCIKNINLLKGKGIPKINMKNIYDYSVLSDIILHIKP